MEGGEEDSGDSQEPDAEDGGGWEPEVNHESLDEKYAEETYVQNTGEDWLPGCTRHSECHAEGFRREECADDRGHENENEIEGADQFHGLKVTHEITKSHG
jgi:hypothetical protein